jgi:hypothetical protein
MAKSAANQAAHSVTSTPAPPGLKRRKVEEEDVTSLTSKKQRTRVRYVHLTPDTTPSPYRPSVSPAVNAIDANRRHVNHFSYVNYLPLTYHIQCDRQIPCSHVRVHSSALSRVAELTRTSS